MMWTSERYQNYIEELKKNIDTKYRAFTEKIVSTQYPIIGIRMPILKQEAKKIAQGDFVSFLECSSPCTYEEVLLKGLVIARIKDLQTYCFYFSSFLKQIDNWAVCDTFVSSSKIIASNKEFFFQEGCKLIQSSKPFVARVGYVIFLTYCNCDTYPKKIFPLITKYQSDSYYVAMAIAWLLSVLLVDFYDEVKQYLEEGNVSCFILQKTISKARDSYRISKEKKEELLVLKKRLI